MVQVNTKAFGEIAIEDDKIINFEQGILGFPDLKRFTLIYDIEKGVHSGIKWLQSLDEPGFAMPVLEPGLVIEEYAPVFDRELLEPLSEKPEEEELLMLVTVTVPKDITAMTVNLKAPIIVSMVTHKAVQVITESEEYGIKYAIYDKLKARKAGE
ncbi:MAG: flagellar assembly protein FliW [Lachnospiraceae bacterium]|nr:flagellar assembly protein FliW [Lachnospiraceae bacterium]